MKCEICGKKATFGHSISHSKRHTLRRWLPNIHLKKLVIDGKAKRINICTRCLRTHNKVPA